MEEPREDASPPMTGKEAVILDLLRDGREAYGLELIRKSEGSLKRGSIYVLLQRMERKGFVSSQKEVKEPGASLEVRKQYYVYARLTAQSNLVEELHREFRVFGPVE